MKRLVFSSLYAIVLLATLILVIEWVPDSARPCGPYGEVDVESLRMINGSLEVHVKSGGTGAPVKLLYIEVFYDEGVEKINLNTTLKYFGKRNITIPLERSPNLIIIHYLDIFDDEERMVMIRTSNTLVTDEINGRASPFIILRYPLKILCRKGYGR